MPPSRADQVMQVEEILRILCKQCDTLTDGRGKMSGIGNTIAPQVARQEYRMTHPLQLCYQPSVRDIIVEVDFHGRAASTVDMQNGSSSP